MSEPFFFPRIAHTPLADIVACTGAAVGENTDLSIIITGAGAIGEAGPGELTFLDCPENTVLLETSCAAACFVKAAQAPLLPKSTIALVVADPYPAFVLALRKLFPQALRPSSLFGTAGINPGASVHPEARLEHDVIVDPGAIIGPRAEIGSGTIIGANSVIGYSVRIGRECSIGPQVAISHALIGDRVTLHSGVRIGQTGVYAGHCGPGPCAKALAAAPRLGRVIIQDGVEIGANSTIDRGPAGDTVIGEETRIGNLVHISENVMVGRYCSIPAQAKIARGAQIEDQIAPSRTSAGPPSDTRAGGAQEKCVCSKLPGD